MFVYIITKVLINYFSITLIVFLYVYRCPGNSNTNKSTVSGSETLRADGEMV